jgi:hypothetical protein
MLTPHDYINKYRVDYMWSDAKYEDNYVSKPFDTIEQARAYATRVVQRAAARDDIDVWAVEIIYTDENLDLTQVF